MTVKSLRDAIRDAKVGTHTENQRRYWESLVVAAMTPAIDAWTLGNISTEDLLAAFNAYLDGTTVGV